MSEDTKGSQFRVDLGGIRLTPLLEKEVDLEIQGVVLRALARMKVPDRFDQIDFKDLGPEIRGIYAVPTEDLLKNIAERGRA